MWLYKRKVGSNDNQKMLIALSDEKEVIELAYWRKRFIINEKFLSFAIVDKDLNCENIVITKDYLLEIRDWAIEYKDYDENDFTNENDLKELVELIDKVLKETDFENEEVFYHAWW